MGRSLTMSFSKFKSLCQDIDCRPSCLVNNQNWVYKQVDPPDNTNIYTMYMFTHSLTPHVHRSKYKPELIVVMRNFFMCLYDEGFADVDVELFIDLFCVMTTPDLILIARRLKVMWGKFVKHPCKTCKACKTNVDVHVLLKEIGDRFKNKRGKRDTILEEYKLMQKQIKRCWKVRSLSHKVRDANGVRHIPSFEFDIDIKFTYNTTVTYPPKRNGLYFYPTDDTDDTDDTNDTKLKTIPGSTFPVTRQMPKDLILEHVFSEMVKATYFYSDPRVKKCILSYIYSTILTQVDIPNTDKIMDLMPKTQGHKTQ